ERTARMRRRRAPPEISRGFESRSSSFAESGNVHFRRRTRRNRLGSVIASRKIQRRRGGLTSEPRPRDTDRPSLLGESSMAAGRAPFAILIAALLPGLATAQPTTVRARVNSSGVQGDAPSGGYAGAAVSADGRFVAFQSYAWNLVPNDTTNYPDPD